MNTVPPLQQRKREEFVMPKVAQGDIVILLSTPTDTNGFATVVTQVNNDSINVVKLGGTIQYLEGIRHREDPILERSPELLTDNGGCWEESHHMRRIREIERSIVMLSEEIGRLKGLRSSRHE